MSAWEINEKYALLMQYAEDPDVDPQMVQDAMDELNDEVEELADNYARVISELSIKADMLDAKAAAIKAEGDRVKGNSDKIRANIDRMKRNLQGCMMNTGKTKFKTDFFSFGIVKNPPKLVIDKPDSIPPVYLIPQPPKIDTTAIKKVLKGTKEEWAHLEQTERLDIK